MGSSITAGSSIQCSGVSSCNGAKSLEGGTVSCSGVSSCISAKNIEAETMLACNADSSCMSVSSAQAGGSVSCGGGAMVSGTGSCNGLNFGDFSDLKVQTDAVYCSGAFSCESGTYRGVAMINFDGESAGYLASVEGAEQINARGRNAMDGARIDSGGIAEMGVLFSGDNVSGSGATIICREGSVCRIDCFGNACAALSVVCEGASTDCVVACSDEQGHVCPSVTNGRDNTFSGLHAAVIHKVVDSFSAMTEAMTSCEAAQECSRKMVSGSGDASCTGDESCIKARFTNDGDVACDGNMACADAEFKGDGDISCTGAEACANGEYAANGENLICSGSSSCSALEASSGVDSECSGLKSCADAVLRMDDDADLSCSGEKSCHGSEIAAIKKQASVMLTCIGKHSCQKADIAVDGIQCPGGNSCQEASMSVSGEVVFNGANSGLEAVLEVVASSTITATGYNSLMKSLIDSAGNDVSVELSGWYAGGKATLRCRAGSSCSLTCVTGGCFEMSFVCEDGADCTVSPAECADAQGEWNVAAQSYCPVMLTEMPADDSSSSRGGRDGRDDAQRKMFVDGAMVRGVHVDGYVMLGCAVLVVGVLMVWWLWERMVVRKEYVQV